MSVRPVLVWLLLIGVIGVPVLVAALSPLQQGRNTAYVIGGLSGIVALALLLVQPLLAAGYLPGAHTMRQRRWHRWTGGFMFVAVAVHIIGLYLTSPDDMTDAMLLVAPTPFSVYGVIGFWSIVLTAILVAVRRHSGLSNLAWSIAHNLLAVIVVGASVVHALMIDGAMGSLSKRVLCICVLLVTMVVIFQLRVVRVYFKR